MNIHSKSSTIGTILAPTQSAFTVNSVKGLTPDSPLSLPGKIVSHLPALCFSILCCAIFTGCTYVRPLWDSQYDPNDPNNTNCKNHAYVRQVLVDYISTRYHSNAPIRLAIIPFSVPANLSAYSSERPGLGNILAWGIHARMLQSHEIPIVEVLNRHDWPGKRDEFFTGNFGAIQTAREAGYDMVLTGIVDPIKSSGRLQASSKVIDTASGVTVWFGQSSVTATKDFMHTLALESGLEGRAPSDTGFNSMVEELSRCVVKGVLDTNPTG